jgi:quercetin dioxygenase-like cupin family protein
MKKLFLIACISLLSAQTHAQYKKDVIIEPLLKTDTTSIGQKIDYPHVQDAEVTMLKVTIPPGGSTGWHRHEFPVFAYVLKGTLTVELENGKSLQFLKNSSFSEVFNTFHNGINKGSENVVLIAFYMGEKGKPLSIRKD